MSADSLRGWRRADRLLDTLTLGVGVLMILYVGFAVFGFVSSSARHYAAFVLFVMVMSCFASFKVVVGERIGKKYAEEGYKEEGVAPDRIEPWTWVKGVTAALGSILSISGAAYILIHADRLETTAP